MTQHILLILHLFTYCLIAFFFCLQLFIDLSLVYGIFYVREEYFLSIDAIIWFLVMCGKDQKNKFMGIQNPEITESLNRVEISLSWFLLESPWIITTCENLLMWRGNYWTSQFHGEIEPNDQGAVINDNKLFVFDVTLHCLTILPRPLINVLYSNIFMMLHRDRNVFLLTYLAILCSDKHIRDWFSIRIIISLLDVICMVLSHSSGWYYFAQSKLQKI